MHIQSFKAIPASWLVLLAAVPPAAAEDGVSVDKIVFGQAAALGGPAGALGQGMKIGIEAAFAEVNKAGGVKGRKLELRAD
jgi:branched-chain amino acid transport system substrate-binding protein